MALAEGLLDQDQFNCTICLDLLKDPVSIPCGHSYCMCCIKDCWDQDDDTGIYNCPQCRQIFTPRPVLGKNMLLVEVVEKLKKTGLQAAPPAHCYAGPGDVVCDVCTGRKHKAIKSCLVCLASYCETHLQAHYESPPLKKHKLVKVTGNLQEKICSHHDKLLEAYCRTDQQCICLLCVMDEHRGHDTVPVVAEWTEKQKQLGETQSKFQQRIQEREKELQDLRQAAQSFKAAVCQAEGLLEQMEQEIAEMRRRGAELEQLSHTEDQIKFLQSFKCLCVPPGTGNLPGITVSPDVSFEAVRKCVSELKERLEDVCKGEMSEISKTGRAVGVFEAGEPSEARAPAAEVETCPLCMKEFQNKQRLICTHAFCEQCLRRCVGRVGFQCPMCLQALRLVEDQPEGEMTVKHLKDIKGHECILITYTIPSGIQTEAHPNPGKPFTGIETQAWLPHEQEHWIGMSEVVLHGQEVLELLQRAFEQKLVFTVAATDGAADRVVFNDIPHARNFYECSKPGFLKGVAEVLGNKYIE